MLEVRWKKLWQIEVHLHRECYGNCKNWQKTWQIAVICQIPQSFFTVWYSSHLILPVQLRRHLKFNA